MPEEPTIGEVLRRLDRLDQRLDRVFDDYETRLRKVERWVWSVPPTLLVACGSLFASMFGGS